MSLPFKNQGKLGKRSFYQTTTENEDHFGRRRGNKSLSNVRKTGSSVPSSKNVVSSFDKTALIQDCHPEVIC